MFEKNVGTMTFKNVDSIPCTHEEGFPIENPTQVITKRDLRRWNLDWKDREECPLTFADPWVLGYIKTFKIKKVLKISGFFFFNSVQGARCGSLRKFLADRRIFKHC